MASAKNKVIAGDYTGQYVVKDLMAKGHINVAGKTVAKWSVSGYDLITEEKVKSGSSAILRGMAGVVVLGSVGILAGLSAKNRGINTVALAWLDGKKSLMEIDDKLYKMLVSSMF
ncbi:MAG: hypothetical protein NC398_10765 [Acetatifactor muris]|nr:hypothetical protein [Acetatifactor muris]